MEPIMNPVRFPGAGPIHMKKRGRKAYLYVDMTTEAPAFLSSFDDEPIGCIAQSFDVDEVVQAFGDRIVWFQEPQREQVVVSEISDELLQAELAALSKNTSSIITKNPSPLITTPVSNIEEKALSEFKMLLIRYDALDGKKKAAFKIEVQAVANFLLSVAPHLAPVLQQIKDELSKPKFSL